MAIRKLARRGVFGLEAELAKKFEIANIKTTFSDVQSANNGTTVPSTSAAVEMYNDIQTSLTNLQNSVDGIIDDSAVNGANVTWSVDQIKSYIASVDDSVVVANLDERDNLSNLHPSLVAFVLDTTGDTSLGDEEGKSAAYIYTDNGWVLYSVLRDEISTDNLLTKNDIVNDTTTGGTDKVASAEVAKQLAQQIVDSANGVNKVIVSESLAISSDQITLSAPAEGDIIDGAVEVLGDSGYVLVDATLGDDKQTVTLAVENAGEFDGKNARVSYLKIA